MLLPCLATASPSSKKPTKHPYLKTLLQTSNHNSPVMYDSWRTAEPGKTQNCPDRQYGLLCSEVRVSAFELWPLTGLLSILLETDEQQCTGKMKLSGGGVGGAWRKMCFSANLSTTNPKWIHDKCVKVSGTRVYPLNGSGGYDNACSALVSAPHVRMAPKVRVFIRAPISLSFCEFL